MKTKLFMASVLAIALATPGMAAPVTAAPATTYNNMTATAPPAAPDLDATKDQNAGTVTRSDSGHIPNTMPAAGGKSDDGVGKLVHITADGQIIHGE